MTAKETSIGAVLAVVIAALLALGIMLLPFEAAGGIDCEAPLKGADPKEQAEAGFLRGREEAACNRGAGSRVTTGGITGSLYLLIGLAGVLAPQSRIEKALFNDEDVEQLYEG